MEAYLILRVVVLCIIVYFIVANTIFIWRRVQWQKTFTSKWAVRYMRLTDFSRSCFLLLAAIQNVWKIIVDSKDITWRLTSCSWYFRLPSLFFTAVSFFQIMYVYSRLVVVYSCMVSHSWKTSCRTVGLIFFVWIILGLTNQLLMTYDVKSGECIVVINLELKVICIVALILAAFTSFWMFYSPLRNNLLLGKYLDLENFEKIEDSSCIGYYGMKRCSTRSLLSEPNNHERLIEKNNVIQEYTNSVRRNLYCWLLTIFLTVSWFITFNLCEDKPWYWRQGKADFYTTVTMLLLYLSMVACEKYWYKMFIFY